jgi:hypothetical protein
MWCKFPTRQPSIRQLLTTVLANQKVIMNDLTQLTNDVNLLQTDLTALATLTTGTVIPDIVKAVALLQQGDQQGAIDALDKIVQTAKNTVDGLQTSVAAADASLEGAEGGGTSSSS